MENDFTTYVHHGERVWVRTTLRGRHREHCLCFACARLKCGESDNCPTAEALYAMCVAHGLTTPVWECPAFKEKTNGK